MPVMRRHRRHLAPACRRAGGEPAQPGRRGTGLAGQAGNRPSRAGGEPGQLRPLYACRPLKNTFTMVKLKITEAKPTIDSQADGLPRQPRVARAWM